MSLTSFNISNQKSIRSAVAERVPPVMVIAGPNGVGKSTLLYAIKQGAGSVTSGTKLLYQGPHRVLRRTTVSRRWLTGAARWFMELLSSGDVSGYEGLSFGDAARTPDNVDEAGSTIKHTLGKIENRRQTIHTALIDRMRIEKTVLTPDLLPDVYNPLRDLTRFLLPHLEFSRVDFDNEDNIRALWNRTDDSQSLEIDIDDLSSGEKSIVVLFLPFDRRSNPWTVAAVGDNGFR
jgi:energy-coupling factor transporter ATP-binding protein EcfA2